jgi:drug/metabolite transporter (DMT)-like permease
MMLFGTLMIAPVFLWNHGWLEVARLSCVGWVALLFLGFGCSGLGYLFWYGGLERLEVSQVAAFLYIEPFVTLLAAMVLLHEPVHALAVAGGLIVLASVFVLQRAGNQR